MATIKTFKNGVLVRESKPMRVGEAREKAEKMAPGLKAFGFTVGLVY